jgi:hypothetical protein
MAPADAAYRVWVVPTLNRGYGSGNCHTPRVTLALVNTA